MKIKKLHECLTTTSVRIAYVVNRSGYHFECQPDRYGRYRHGVPFERIQSNKEHLSRFEHLYKIYGKIVVVKYTPGLKRPDGSRVFFEKRLVFNTQKELEKCCSALLGKELTEKYFLEKKAKRYEIALKNAFVFISAVIAALVIFYIVYLLKGWTT